MKTRVVLPALLLSLFFLVYCGTSPDVEVVKAEFVEDIYFSGMNMPPMIPDVKSQVSVGEKGVWCSYEDHHIIKLLLSFNFKSINTQAEIGSDEHRDEVFDLLSKNAHLYDGTDEIKRFWGYWPKEVTETSASEMTLFYVIPTATDLNNLKFEYDRSI